jgi:hypothetical protein
VSHNLILLDRLNLSYRRWEEDVKAEEEEVGFHMEGSEVRDGIARCDSSRLRKCTMETGLTIVSSSWIPRTYPIQTRKRM